MISNTCAVDSRFRGHQQYKNKTALLPSSVNLITNQSIIKKLLHRIRSLKETL